VALIRPNATQLWRWKWWLLLLLLSGVLVWVGWQFPHELLKVDSGPVTADVLVVLGGAPTERPEYAAVLFKQGSAPKIIVTGAGKRQVTQPFLVTNGVPAAAISWEDHAQTTYENAKFSVPLLRQMGAHRVIIVTSWYHSRRALACFRHFAPDITFYSRPSNYGYNRVQWSYTGINRYIKMEYLKISGYLLWHGVWPF
jgi:uncharacterized SAM-binding protein YcdF (DUF218 family)